MSTVIYNKQKYSKNNLLVITSGSATRGGKIPTLFIIQYAAVIKEILVVFFTNVTLKTQYYKNASSRRFVSEREDIVLLRMAYLRKIRKFRQQGRHIVYLDETWLNTNHVVKGDWLDVPSTSMSVFEPHCKGTHRKVPSGKGTRLIILDVGSFQQGLIPGCRLIFESKTNSSDYHDEMNKEHFTEWFRETLLPKLPPRSVIIMDNSSVSQPLRS
ncbi:unnamed protein product [Mytilus edulis]|uniref:Tc1-like transposase DDE domain-containing protein n=1 Tax=Mytilus edulis TaxID=6550 RepID=A0A8S3VK24_MYTED|nr:unnamed protein product [Mytilus edulis]